MQNPNLDLSTEDKEAWTKRGSELEDVFLRTIAPLLCPQVRLNPAKAYDKFAPDFVDENGLADLKCQSTPFFTAIRYGYDPSRTVTFNRKDLERYLRIAPELNVYFYVHWLQLEYFKNSNVTVNPMHGVWRIPVAQIELMRTSGQLYEHAYSRRTSDTRGNARSSFLLRLDDLELIGTIDD